MKRPPVIIFTGGLLAVSGCLSVSERSSVSICVDVSAEYHNTLNESPDNAYLAEHSAAEKREEKLCYTLSGIAEIEVVYAKSAKKDTEQTCCHLRLCSGRRHCLSAIERKTAVHTYCCTRLNGISAVSAVVSSLSDICSAGSTGSCTLLNRITTILTIHKYPSNKNQSVR